MKKIFAFILSFGLVIAPMPVAHAQGGGGGYAKQILGMANGIIGSTIVTRCKLANMQFSLMAYMAGSMVYIFAEIAGGGDQKKKQTQNSQKLNEINATMAEGGDYQKATIQAQIDDEKGTLEHIKKRRKWLMAVKVMYGVATALAALELILKAPPILKPDIGACFPNPGASTAMTQALAYAYTGINGFAGGGVMGAAVSMGSKAVTSSLKIFPASVTATTLSAESANIPLLNTSVGRIAFFGAATALVMMIDGDLGKEEGKSKKKIADLEKIKSDFENTTRTSNELAEGKSNSDTEGDSSGSANSALNTASNKNYALKALPQGVEMTKQCFSNSTGVMDYSETACKSAYKFSKPKFDMNMNLPTLVAGANATNDLGQAIADGDMAKADVAAGSLNSMAGRLDSIREGLMKKANDQLIASGQKPIDIKGELKRQMDNMDAALMKNSLGSGSFDLAGMDLKGSDVNLASDDKKNELEIQTAASPDSIAVPTSAGPTLDESSFSGMNEDGFGTDANTNAKVATLSESLNEFESNEGDIAPDNGVSIFKQVSNRYFLNYTKIFDRKKIETPLAPE